MGYWMFIRIALIALLVINIMKTIFFYSVKVLNRLRNYRNLWKNFTFGLDVITINKNLKGCSELEVLTNCEKKCSIEGGNSFCGYRWHAIQIFGLIFLAILLSTFLVYDEPPRIQNVDSVQKHRQEKEKDFLDIIMWKTENVCEQTENRCYHLLIKSKRLPKKLRQQIYQKEMKNGSVNICAEMDPTCPKYIKCHPGETKKFICSNPNDCSYLFNNFQDGRIFQGNYHIMVLVVEEENFDEVPFHIRIGNTRNFDRPSGNQRLTEYQYHEDNVPTIDSSLHRTNNMRSLLESGASSGFNSLSLRFDDSSGIENASLQHSVLQNRDFPMSYASGQQLRHTLSSGYQSGRRRYFSSGQHSFSLGQRIAEVNEEPNSNVNHTSLNSEANDDIEILENNAAQCSSNLPHQEAVECENLSQQGALSQERGDWSNHQVSTNVRPTGTRHLDGENIQSDTNTITIHNTETKTRSNDHSELSSNTPSQCLRNTSLFPTPLMNFESHTHSQCSRNTSLFPTPLMNSESHTHSQCSRNTSLFPTPFVNSESHTHSQCSRNTSLFPTPFVNSESHTHSQCSRNTSLFPTPLLNSESHTHSQCSRNTSLFPTPFVNSESHTHSQCSRNTSLFPTPLMNSESHTHSQCSRNTSLFPTPLMNSESHTPSQCLRNTRFSPMMNSELPESHYEKNSVPFVERFSQQLPVSVTSNKENTPADSPIVAVSTENIQTNEPEIHSDLSGTRVNLYQSGRQFGTNDRIEEKLDYTQSIVCEDKFCLPVSDDIDDIDEDQLFGDGSTGLTELSVDTGTDDDDENRREEDSCACASENQKPGKDPDFKI